MDKISKQCKYGFLSTILWGLVAHGIMLTNKLSWNDDITELFGIGSTVPSGRWMLQIMKDLEMKFFGSSMYSMPLFNGLLCVLCIAVIVALFIDLFEIKNTASCIALGGVMVAFPVVTGMFGYMFTAPAYMIGLLMGIVGAYLICKYRKWYSYLVALVLCASCVGTYQAFVSMIVCVFVIYMIKCNWENTDKVLPDMVKEAVYYVASCLGFMVVYLVLNKFALWYYQTALLGYSGINNMGSTSIGGYIQRIILAYKEFFVPDVTRTAHMFPMGIGRIYKIVLVFVVLVSIYYLIRTYKKNLWSGIYTTALVLVLPLATNFIYFMCDLSAIHSLTVYGKAFVLVYLIFLMDKLMAEEVDIKKYVGRVGIAVAIVMAVMYCRFDNMCYLKAEMQQSQTIEYFTTLVTRIKSAEGYADELPVVYVNHGKIVDASITRIPQYEEIKIIPYTFDTHYLVNNYVWHEYVMRWVGYSPVILPEGVVSGNEEVANMPSYPDDGSIKVIDGMVVIKF